MVEKRAMSEAVSHVGERRHGRREDAIILREIVRMAGYFNVGARRHTFLVQPLINANVKANGQ